MSETVLSSDDIDPIVTEMVNLTVNTPTIEEFADTNDSDKSFESCDNKEEESEKSFASCSLNIENKSNEDFKLLEESVVQDKSEENEDDDDIKPGECRENPSSDEEVSLWDDGAEEYLHELKDSVTVSAQQQQEAPDKIVENQPNDKLINKKKPKNNKRYNRRNNRGSGISYYYDSYYNYRYPYYYDYGYYNEMDSFYNNDWQRGCGSVRNQKEDHNQIDTAKNNNLTNRGKKPRKSKKGRKTIDNEAVDTNEFNENVSNQNRRNNKSANQNKVYNNDKDNEYKSQKGAPKSKYSNIDELTSIKITVDRDNIGTRKVQSVIQPDDSLSTVTWDGTQFRRDHCQWDVSHDVPHVADKEVSHTKHKTHPIRHTAPRFARGSHTRATVLSMGTGGGDTHCDQVPPTSTAPYSATLTPVTPPCPIFLQPLYFAPAATRLNQFSTPFHPQFVAGHVTETPVTGSNVQTQSNTNRALIG